MRFLKILSFLAALCFATAIHAQTTIQYWILQPTVTGIGGVVTYSGSNPDSVFTVLISSGKISGSPVYEAYEYTQQSTGQLTPVNHYVVSQTTRNAYINAYYFSQGSGLGAVYHYSVLVNLVDTGLTAIFTPTGNFVVTGVLVHGNNDTTGYTSNADLDVGFTTYAEIVDGAAPSLGKPGTAAATLISPRYDVPAGKTLYVHIPTAAVATTETCYVDVYGYLR